MSEVSRIKVRFHIEKLGTAEGELARFLAPRTVEAVLEKLPISGRAAIWKEEVYFETPVKMGSEKAKAKVETGEIAYWPMGSAICIFYGKTQPYSPVNPLGTITSNLELFAKVKAGASIRLEKA